MILDSTFVNDMLREADDALDCLAELRDAETPVALSSLTVFEVGIGLRGESAQYRAQFDAQVDDLVIVPLGETATHRALTIQHDLLDHGQSIGTVDVLIAGTAAESADPRVLTRNVDEFERVDAIEVETY